MAQGYQQVAQNETGDGGKKKMMMFGGSCCCCLLLVFLLLQLAVGMYAGPQWTNKHANWEANITLCDKGGHCDIGDGKRITPDILVDHMWWDSCASQKLRDEYDKTSKELPYKLVKFKSRQGNAGQQTVYVSAWWLPAKDPNGPRIVVQHGNNVNFNDRTVQIAGYMLRSMGFSVLTPNLRDHGCSQNSEHGGVGWGWDYYLDLLGAWDYAVNDPEGKLGGKKTDNEVGIMGFSMGGFTTSIAFGREPRVPAAWVDSGVFNPKDTLEFHLGLLAGKFLASMFIRSAWFFAERDAGVDLDHRTPANCLPAFAKVKRPIAVTQGQQDVTVPPQETEKLIALLKENPHLYEIREEYKPDYKCGESTHCTMHLWKPDIYRKKLCDFWSGVFGGHDCGLDKLPSLEGPPPTEITDRRLAAPGDFRFELPFGLGSAGSEDGSVVV